MKQVEKLQDLMCNCNQSNDTFALQESSVRVIGEYNLQVADAWGVIQVNFLLLPITLVL